MTAKRRRVSGSLDAISKILSCISRGRSGQSQNIAGPSNLSNSYIVLPGAARLNEALNPAEQSPKQSIFLSD
jgi:hypothetical protein